MMITIHGFPAKTKFQDVKILIKQECNISDFILDNLITDADGTKKVRIGLADNTEGYKVMKCLDGYRMPGNFILKAVPIGKAASNQPPQESSFDSRPSYQSQGRNDYSNTPRNDYMGPGPNDYNDQGSHGPLSHGGIHGSHAPIGGHGPGAPLGGIHGSVGSHAPVGPHGPRATQGGPHSHGGPSPWTSGGGNNTNQWNTPMANQVPQNTFGFNSPQENINPSYGQQPHQSHPQPPYNQARAADQSYGYPPKNVPEVVPANPRYRWVRKAEPEPKYPKSPHPDEVSPSPSSVDDIDETSQDVLDDGDKQDIGETDNTVDPSKTTKSRKARKREIARLRNINNLTSAKRRRLFFWLKQGKTFMEARELCEIRHNRIPEYPAAKAEKKRRAREIALRRMSPDRQARAIKVDRLKGRGLPGDPPPERPPGVPIRVRILDELGLMSQEKIEMLEDKILELVDAETEGNGPRFVGYVARSGCLILSCANTQTVEWLENHLPDLHLWERAKIKLINLSELPKPVIGVAFVADPDLDDEEILSMLKVQNQGIDFSDWWITSKKPEHTGQTVTFTIDKCSVDKLAERNNFVYLGHKKTKIRLKSKNAQAPHGQGVLPTMKQMGKGNGKMGMPPYPHMGQKSKGPIGKMSLPPREQREMAPMDQIGLGPMGMGPIDQIGMGSMGPMGMGPMGQMRMGSIGSIGMGPMEQMGMGPMGPLCMGPMRPMAMGPPGPMARMGFHPSTSSSAEMFRPSQGSSYVSGHSKPKYFGGGNQSKHFSGGYPPKKYGGGNERSYFGGGNQPKKFGGGGKHSKKKTNVPAKNNSGPNPQQSKAPKKLNPSKVKRNKERMMEYLAKAKKPGNKPIGETPS